MADEKTGAVRFRGDPDTMCFEAQDYHEEGSARLQPGDELTGIPESMLKRFLLNAKFEPVGDFAQEIYDSSVVSVAARINGAMVRELKPDERKALEEQAAEASVSLDQQNKTQLLATADRVGVDANNNMTKAEIIEAIESSAGGGKADPLESTTESTTTPPQEPGGSEGGES